MIFELNFGDYLCVFYKKDSKSIFQVQNSKLIN